MFNPVNVEIKLPVPVPSLVCESAMVGFASVLQHTPLSATLCPPSSVMFPPETTDEPVIEETRVVVMVGSA